LHGRAILYADRVTDSMRRAMDETQRRREKQQAFNEANGITARGVSKAVRDLIDGVGMAPAPAPSEEPAFDTAALRDEKALAREIRRLEQKMNEHARNLEFEQAAAARDALHALKDRALWAANF
jgi:excinuclease ABC subunit B